MKDTIEIIGPCSKGIEGKGWTTNIPESILQSFGYQKITENDLVVRKEDYNKLIESAKLLVTCVADQQILKDKTKQEVMDKIWHIANQVVNCTKFMVDGKQYLHLDALKEILKSCGANIDEKIR